MHNVCTLTRFHHYVFRPITRQQIFTFKARLRTERSAKKRVLTGKAQFRLTVWRRCGAEGLSKGSLLFWHCSSLQVTLCSTSVDFSKIDFWPLRSPKYPTARLIVSISTNINDNESIPGISKPLKHNRVVILIAVVHPA